MALGTAHTCTKAQQSRLVPTHNTHYSSRRRQKCQQNANLAIKKIKENEKKRVLDQSVYHDPRQTLKLMSILGFIQKSVE